MPPRRCSTGSPPMVGCPTCSRASIARTCCLRSMPLDDLAARRLAQEFFARDAATVARALVGCALVHGRRAGVIVETEAYVGPHDLACHARFGATARTSVMFGPAGVTYVYLCYGVHEMFNIVTGAVGAGESGLVRAG